jgi:hypothetical protein
MNVPFNLAAFPNDFVTVRFVAFPATEYDEIFSGYQPGQMVER